MLLLDLFLHVLEMGIGQDEGSGGLALGGRVLVELVLEGSHDIVLGILTLQLEWTEQHQRAFKQKQL